MKIKVFVMLLISSLFISSCHSFNPVDKNSSSFEQQLNTGDEIYVVTNEGKKYHFVIVSINEQTIYGKKGEVIHYSEISSISKAEKDNKKSGRLVASIGAGAVVGASLLMYLLGGL